MKRFIQIQLWAKPVGCEHLLDLVSAGGLPLRLVTAHIRNALPPRGTLSNSCSCLAPFRVARDHVRVHNTVHRPGAAGWEGKTLSFGD
jgi:hypothetical protein